MTEVLKPISTEELKGIKGSLDIEKLVKLNDDKTFEKLSYPEQKLLNRMMNKKQERRGKYKISVRSLIQMLNKVKSIYKKNGRTFNGTNIELLLDTKTIDEYLSTKKTSKDYYNAILSVLNTFPSHESVKKHYYDMMVGNIKKVDKDIKENLKTEKQSKNWMKYDDILKNYRMNKNKLSPENRLLMSLVILYPRRVQDYQKLHLNKIGKGKKKDENFNYINVNRYGIPTTFDFNRSKSQNYEPLGTNQPIPNKLKKIIGDYITSNDMKNGQIFFPGPSGSIMTSDGFSKRIKNIFKVITGKEINSNMWRHIIASNLEGKGYSMNQQEKVAAEMGHSLMMNLKYRKR